MEIRKLTTRLACVLIAISFSAVGVAADTPVGYVVEIKGTWVLIGVKVKNLSRRFHRLLRLVRPNSAQSPRSF